MAEYYPNIEKARIRADKNLSDILRFLDITEEEYFQYERGEKESIEDILVQLAGYYGTNVDYLLGRSDVFEPYPSKWRELFSIKIAYDEGNLFSSLQ